MSASGGGPQPVPARLTHDAALALISARLDGPLDPVTNRALLAHLATCPSCRAFAEQMEAMSRGLRDLPHLPPSPTVSRQVRERLAADRPWWTGLSLAASGRLGGMQAAAMMLILLGAVATVLLVRMFDDGGKGTPPGTITAASITATSQAAHTPSPSMAPSETPPSVAQNVTPTRTPRPSVTATLVNVTVQLTPTPTPTATAQPTERPTETPTAQPTNTPKPTRTATEEPSPTETRTPKPTATETEQPTETPTAEPTETAEPTNTPKPTRTATEEPTDTPVPKPSATPEPTETATAEPTTTEVPATETPTAEPTATATEESAATPIAEPTDTSEPTDTPEPSRTPKPTKTPEPTVEPTQTGTPPIVQRSSEGGQPATEPSVEPKSTEAPTEQATAAPTQNPAGDDTTQIQSTGGQTIEPRNPSGSQAGGQATEIPFEANGNGTGGGGDVSSPNEPTVEPTAEATEPPTEGPSEEPSGPLDNAEVVARFPDGAGATTGLLFAPDGGAFAVEVPTGIVVAAADGTPLITLAGTHPVWSPLGHELLYQDADGGVSIWDRPSGEVISVTSKTAPDGQSVADVPAGWNGPQLVYLRTFPDAPDRKAELHAADWDGSHDAILATGPLGAILASPVATPDGVLVLTEAGWGRIAYDGSAVDLGPNRFGAVGEPVTSPYGTLVLYEADGQLVLASADSPGSPYIEPIACDGCGFAFSPSGEQIVVADGSGLRIYRYDDGSLVASADGPATSPGWSDAGIYFIVPGDPPTLRLVSPDDLPSS